MIRAGDKVEVTNDSCWETDWIFITESEGYNICRNEFSGALRNFRYIRPLWYGAEAASGWKYEETSIFTTNIQ